MLECCQRKPARLSARNHAIRTHRSMVHELKGKGMSSQAIQPPIILLVDDDPEALILLRRLLLSFARHHEIVAVESGVEALALTAVRQVALVITDYHMPGMNGVQLTGAIKAASPETRVAIVTAYDVQDVG